MRTRECDIWADVVAMIEYAGDVLEDGEHGLSGLCLVVAEIGRHSGINAATDAACARIYRVIDDGRGMRCSDGSRSCIWLHPPREWLDNVRLIWARGFMQVAP